MVRSRTPSQGGGSQVFEMERKYSVPSNPDSRPFSGTASEDLHAWSIYRQNLNSDFTDSALGSADKSPLPYGNFQLRDTTVQSILSHPRYGPKSPLGTNMFTYLKFGLPRVFPPNHNGSNRSGRGTPQQFVRNASARAHMTSRKPGSRGPREGSSGYDSSDNETSNQYKQSRKYRSDPDFRMQQMQQAQPPFQQREIVQPQLRLSAMHHGGLHGVATGGSQWNRQKSVSEANLLASDYTRQYQPGGFLPPPPHLRDPRRNSVAEFGHHMHHDVVDHTVVSRPMSKSESHFSMPVSRKGPSVMRSDMISHEDEINPSFIYPHLQVNQVSVWPPDSNSCFSTKTQLLLSELTFEARGGDVLAVMATSEQEGTAILDLIAGKITPARGEIVLNGQRVSKNALRRRVAYAQRNINLCKDMTVVQTLRFHCDLKKPTERLGYLKIDSTDRINHLIEELGLEQVKNTKVSSMTVSEKRRLNVACHLLLDTDIVLLDQPTQGMDIFDTFFLVEYIRQWANGNGGSAPGRIVILTLHPPTYEIFTMLSRILLISAGRMMFAGRRRNMLPYFTLVDYPCPNYKNPSDYYLDLVTLDDLSAEAMLESSQRIEQLGEIFRQKQPPLSDPGPPAPLPVAIKKSNFLVQGFVLITKAMVYTQPSTFLRWLTSIILAGSLSLIVGAVFWDIPSTDPQLLLNDRLGYHYTMMCVTPWPLLLYLTLCYVRRDRDSVERDIDDGLYGRLTYIITKTIIYLFSSCFVWLIYIIPSYSMSGLYMQSLSNYNGFYIYIGIMLLYLNCLQSVHLAFIYLIPYSDTAFLLASLLCIILFNLTGYTLHIRDMILFIKWIRYISPPSWVLPFLIKREVSQEAIESSSVVALCRNKQVQHQDIIVQLPCPAPNGTQVLFNYGFLPSQNNSVFNDGIVPYALVVFYLIFFFVGCIGFLCNFGGKKRKEKANDNYQ